MTLHTSTKKTQQNIGPRGYSPKNEITEVKIDGQRERFNAFWRMKTEL